MQLQVDHKMIFQSVQFGLLFRQHAKNSPPTIVAEATMLFNEARKRMREQDPDFAHGETPIPSFGVRAAIPRIRGQDTSKYQSYDRRENAYRRTLHFECDAEERTHLQALVQVAKDFNLVEVLWGKGAHLSNIAQQQDDTSLLY